MNDDAIKYGKQLKEFFINELEIHRKTVIINMK